jgi:hypothetical protein
MICLPSALLPASFSGRDDNADSLTFTNNHLRWLAHARAACLEDQLGCTTKKKSNTAATAAAADDDDDPLLRGSSGSGTMKISTNDVKTHILPYMRGGLDQWSESLSGTLTIYCCHYIECNALI